VIGQSQTEAELCYQLGSNAGLTAVLLFGVRGVVACKLQCQWKFSLFVDIILYNDERV
jgi:hypothetical protein